MGNQINETRETHIVVLYFAIRETVIDGKKVSLLLWKQ